MLDVGIGSEVSRSFPRSPWQQLLDERGVRRSPVQILHLEGKRVKKIKINKNLGLYAAILSETSRINSGSTGTCPRPAHAGASQQSSQMQQRNFGETSRGQKKKKKDIKCWFLSSVLCRLTVPGPFCTQQNCFCDKADQWKTWCFPVCPCVQRSGGCYPPSSSTPGKPGLLPIPSKHHQSRFHTE